MEYLSRNGELSTWGWAQNSLVSVDAAAKSFRYNHDFYLMKHLSHFVDVGAKRVETTGTCDDALGFVNPDGTLVFLVRNESPRVQTVEIHAGGDAMTAQLLADSISTVTLKRA